MDPFDDFFGFGGS